MVSPAAQRPLPLGGAAGFLAVPPRGSPCAEHWGDRQDGGCGPKGRVRLADRRGLLHGIAALALPPIRYGPGPSGPWGSKGAPRAPFAAPEGPPVNRTPPKKRAWLALSKMPLFRRGVVFEGLERWDEPSLRAAFLEQSVLRSFGGGPPCVTPHSDEALMGRDPKHALPFRVSISAPQEPRPWERSARGMPVPVTTREAEIGRATAAPRGARRDSRRSADPSAPCLPTPSLRRPPTRPAPRALHPPAVAPWASWAWSP